MLVKLGIFFPIFGVKIPKIFELPPPIFVCVCVFKLRVLLLVWFAGKGESPGFEMISR